MARTEERERRWNGQRQRRFTIFEQDQWIYISNIHESLFFPNCISKTSFPVLNLFISMGWRFNIFKFSLYQFVELVLSAGFAEQFKVSLTVHATRSRGNIHFC